MPWFEEASDGWVVGSALENWNRLGYICESDELLFCWAGAEDVDWERLARIEGSRKGEFANELPLMFAKWPPFGSYIVTMEMCRRERVPEWVRYGPRYIRAQ